MIQRKLEDKAWYEIYPVALYFACMTMTTVGYGDVTPENQMELVVCMLIMLVSCGVFAYTLNTITSVFSDINKAKESYKRDLDTILLYLRRKDIDLNL